MIFSCLVEPFAKRRGRIMAQLFERRPQIWPAALIFTAMFCGAVLIAFASGGVPTWQNHGPNAGPGLLRRVDDPAGYFTLSILYVAIAIISACLAFFRLPWATITHIRLLILVVFLCLIGQLIYLKTMAKNHQPKKEVAWQQIERLGGHGVWESDMVVVSLAGAGIHDDDLTVFADFPDVQILDLSGNSLTDACFRYLSDIIALETLILIDTNVSEEGVAEFSAAHPRIDIQLEPPPPDAINPFTGKPLSE